MHSIEEAAYYIPAEYLRDCSTGMAYVYSQGLIAGRQQALKILREHERP
jgi:hypothetical protein